MFEDEFRRATSRLFDQFHALRLQLVTSVLVQDEIAPAPGRVREFFLEMLQFAEVVELSEEAVRLQLAYIASRIISEQHSTDAQHVALATVSGCSLIVSWNFKHIANYRLIPKYIAVNALHGYGPIAIFTPTEVFDDE